MAGASSPEFDMLRRQFTTTLQNAASAFRAAGMVVEQYGKIIEHGGIPTAHEITQIALQLPVIAAGGMTVPAVQAGKGKKGKGDVEMIVVDPSHDAGDTKKRKRVPKKEKDPNAPKRPPSAYLLYQNEVRPQVKEANPDKSYNELITEISKLWSGLTPEEKKPYVLANEVAKVRYEKEKAVYDAAHPPVVAGEVVASIDTIVAEEVESSSEDAQSPVAVTVTVAPPKSSKAKAAKEVKESKAEKDKEAKASKPAPKPRKSRVSEPAPPPVLDDSDEDAAGVDVELEVAEPEVDEEEDEEESGRTRKRARRGEKSTPSPKKDKKEKGNKSRK